MRKARQLTPESYERVENLSFERVESDQFEQSPAFRNYRVPVYGRASEESSGEEESVQGEKKTTL